MVFLGLIYSGIITGKFIYFFLFGLLLVVHIMKYYADSHLFSRFTKVFFFPIGPSQDAGILTRKEAWISSRQFVFLSIIPFLIFISLIPVVNIYQFSKLFSLIFILFFIMVSLFLVFFSAAIYLFFKGLFSKVDF